MTGESNLKFEISDLKFGIDPGQAHIAASLLVAANRIFLKKMAPI
jgi:hypothetical protein